MSTGRRDPLRDRAERTWLVINAQPRPLGLTPVASRQGVRRLNPWYGRTLQTMKGDWVLREGQWVWLPRPV